MRIWKKDISVEALTQSHVGTTVEHLGIEFLEVGDDFIRARCPVDNRTRQPSSGWVIGTARPVHRGRSTQVWQIDLTNEAGELTCVSRITMAVLQPRG